MWVKSIPAIPYLKAVRQFAFYRGLLVFTWKDLMIARRLYDEEAKVKN